MCLLGQRRRHRRRKGFDLQLTRYDERGWRATFYTIGMEHSPASATGTGLERTPWLATQRAAWRGSRSSRWGLRRKRPRATVNQ